MTMPKVEILPIERGATPDLNNVNRHTAKGSALVVNSLQRRGAFRSIASAGKDVDTPVVYAGNLTLEKAVEAGFTEIVNIHVRGDQLVNVVRDDLAPGSAEVIALGLEDNESGKQSYNPDIDLLASMAAGDDAILSAIRKEDKVLNGMLEGMGVKNESMDAEPQIDRAAELLEKWQIKTGDLWQIGEHRLLCGSSVLVDDVNKIMDGNKAAICFTSPPYNAGISAKLRGNTSIDDSLYKDEYDDNKTQFEYFDLLRGFTDLALLNCEYVFVNIQVLSGNKLALLDYWHGFADKFCDVAIWDKNHAAPQLAQRVMDSRFEFVLIFGGNGSRAIGTRDFRGMVHNVYSGEPQRHNENASIHAATFPPDFPDYFISNFTNKDELIYEPFAGTGTDLVVCQNLNRKCRAIEISPTYCAVTLERMQTTFPDIEIKRL